MQSQPLQNLGATANLWLFYSSTKFSSKPGGFLVFSDALSILELYKLNQKLYLVSCIVFENEEFYVYFINFGYVLRKLWVLEVRISNLENLELPRGNRPSLQTGELDKTIIFPLSTLSVLRDNDAVVEIELPAPNALPTSAESSRSNSSTWLELYFEFVHVEMFCYFTNQVMSGLHLLFVGKGQQRSLEETMSVGFTPSFGLRQQVVREGV
ncbi:hypothetical protein E5676_scaffold2510G00220 [Cucumis melo var. makuwa]|uniref:Uncharacterized protein n=1 Tax=Cucumis melo var. makuwa TaxID=1194695 RepID=A0A5A7UFD2_CUCMM|nr:hypothetical protein E6C27_scaffold1192G00340 [Cucumis melo var. makuwa]TYK00136.1 hypothetical protein E5676_scaffold2510G00220 [Cucumis melo var. makuwa]